MKFITAGALALFLNIPVLQAQQILLKTGEYTAGLRLNQTTSMPVRLSVERKGKSTILVIKNAEERIELVPSKKDGDTLIIPFPNFDSELRVVASKKKRLNGFWVNYNKVNYRIPFEAQLKTTPDREVSVVATNLTGKWETYFAPKTDDQETAIGVFEQKQERVTGTFLTETGDYRFLEGTIDGTSFYLSSFDGSHAYLATGTLTDGKISGIFYSGKHFQTNWSAEKNEAFLLSNPDSLTFMRDDASLVKFTLKDLNGQDFAFPNNLTSGKVVIIQIMGTWCPNCMDETKYYIELYKKYHEQGLEIISIGYEAPDSFEEQAAKIRRLKERYNLNFTFLVGGKANKNKASQDFAMLNEVISFPTTIFIGRDGLVKRIHTGFNGPGTGKYYTEYVEKTNALIESLLTQE